MSGSVQVKFSALTGESLAEISVDRSSKIASVIKLLADRVPLPPKKSYQLVLGTDLLSADDTLKSHVDGEAAEITAAVQSDDSSDESSGDLSKNKKQAKDKKKKAKDTKNKKDKKKKDGKDKKKKGKDKKKKGKSSSESSSAQKKKKSKKGKEALETEEEVSSKNEWVSQRLDQLRQMKPPMPMELCLVKAQKDWLEHKEKMAEEIEANRTKDWPPMVHEAKKLAEEEARNAGKSEEEIKVEGEKAAGYALMVAKDNGLWKDPNSSTEDDAKTVPLFFQKRKGLDKAVGFLQKFDKK